MKIRGIVMQSTNGSLLQLTKSLQVLKIHNPHNPFEEMLTITTNQGKIDKKT